jgi:cytochrome c-type biogenesis protein CcmH/NrfG
VRRNTVIALIVGLAIGGLLGYQAGSAGRVMREERAAPMAAPAMPPEGTAPAPAQPPGGSLEASQRISAGEAIVARDPKNVRAWISLGNDYFDTHQSKKAIEAYGRALELEPNNPDVLTDQGVMYREAGMYDKAVANFQKANQVNPKHVQSLFNLGVVYSSDLKDNAKAEKAWKKVLEIAPDSPQAQQAREALARLGGTPPAR